MRLLARVLGVVAVVLTLLLSTGGLPADAGPRGGGADRGKPDRGCQRSLPAGVQTIQVRFGGVSYPVRSWCPPG